MRNQLRFIKIVFFVFLMSLAWSCSMKPNSEGNLDEIYVFSDSLDWLDYKEPLNDIFGKEYRTPVLEKEFLLKWVNFQKYEDYKHRRNIFFIGRLDGKDAVSEAIKKLLSEEIIKGVEKGDYFYIPKEDAWAFDQYVLFLVAPSKNDMIQRIYDMGQLAYEDFRKSYFTRLEKQMFERYENEELEKYIAEHFPFTIRVQHDYFVASESLTDNYLWLRRLYPDRSLLIYWVDYSDTMRINKEWVIRQRNKLTRKIYEGDVVVEEETIARRVRFHRWWALRLEGTWKNPKYMIGGPFRSITFIENKTRKVFTIDFYVQAVGKRKKIYLDQLDILAHTFFPKNVEEVAADSLRQPSAK